MKTILSKYVEYKSLVPNGAASRSLNEGESLC